MTSYLNLGCGSRYHPAWTNVDFVATGPGVISCNLRTGIPFEDKTFEVVYHSHLLEHFTRDEAKDFIYECKRVLKPGGIIRVVVPDLEAIVRTYLMTLESVRRGISESEADYAWIIIELLDQLVRNKPGGLMLSYLLNEDIPNIDFILQRCGVEAKKIIHNNQNYSHINISVRQIVLEKIKALIRAIRHLGIMKHKLIRLLLGKEYSLYEIARFRNAGEVHQWMYDDYSLKRLLEEQGFNLAVRTTANESYVKGWTSFNLDTEPDGSIYKPDSLYMEAIIEK
jgi:SAM-dependent methyltransferase